MEEKQDKITFEKLCTQLKVFVILGWIVFALYGLSVLFSLIGIIMGY